MPDPPAGAASATIPHARDAEPCAAAAPAWREARALSVLFRLVDDAHKRGEEVDVDAMLAELAVGDYSTVIESSFRRLLNNRLGLTCEAIDAAVVAVLEGATEPPGRR